MQTVQNQISWLLQKPTDLDLHCLLRQGMSCSAREGLHIGTPASYHICIFSGGISKLARCVQRRLIWVDIVGSSSSFFMLLPFEEWWKGHKVLPCQSVRPSLSASGVSNLRLFYFILFIYLFYLFIYLFFFCFCCGATRALWIHF